LTGYLDSISSLYPGTTHFQAVRSPYHLQTFLDLDYCFNQYQKPKQDRILICPQTRNSLDAEKILIDSGMIHEIANPGEDAYWWNFKPSASWETHREFNEYFTLLVYEEEQVNNQEYYDKLSFLLGDDISKVKSAFAIYNPLLAESFSFCYKTMNGKIKAAEKLFLKDDWNQFSNAPQRQQMLERYFSLAAKWLWNDTNHPKVVPMIQGAKDDTVWNICQNGFALIPNIDEGYYGKGIYFTSDIDYASFFSSSTERGKIMLVAMVAPGNPFPISEHPYQDERGYYGKGLRDGYQSHYSIVSKDPDKLSYPYEPPFNENEHADELVVFQEAQALPLFVIFV